ncbi:uncharacterized protein [Scyliorhinus torazame]|uniref:uncharacterized protein n=1 Tax=Scyliorhinus torazame TaxID=75743 RepID=UPI003B5CE5B0
MPGDLEILNNIKGLLLNNDATSIKVVGNVLLFLFLYGLEEILEENIPCPCQESNATATMAIHPNLVYTILFFTFPSVVLFGISLLVQLRSREWHYCCNNCASCRSTKLNTLTQAAASKCCCKCVLRRFFLSGKLLIPSVIWMTILFLDGDHFACAGLKNLNYTKCAAFNCNNIDIHFRVKEQGLCETSRLIGSILLTSFIIVMLFFSGLHHQFNCDRRIYCQRYALEFEKEEEKLIMEELKKNATETAKIQFEGKSREICDIVFSVFGTQQNNPGAGTPDMRPPNEPGDRSENTPQLSDGGTASGGSQNDPKEGRSDQNSDRAESSSSETDDRAPLIQRTAQQLPDGRRVEEVKMIAVREDQRGTMTERTPLLKRNVHY